MLSFANAIIMLGNYADMPTASAGYQGCLYIASDQDNSIYRCNDAATAWVEILSGGAPSIALEALTDVQVISPTTGQVLTWNATAGKWENCTFTLSTSLESLNDVNISYSVVPGQFLMWNGVDWVNAKALTESNFVDEIPLGTLNGINISFVISYVPRIDSLQLKLNGLELAEGALADYTLISNNITMNYAPLVTDRLIAHYRH